MSKRISLSLIFTVLSCLYSGHALSAQLLINGGFEAGVLENWENLSIRGGLVKVVQRDTCFSALDTRGIQIRGRYAALLGSAILGGETNEADTLSKASFAVLRSNSFTAGDGFAFIALRGLIHKASKKDTFRLRAEILDAQTNSVLISQRFNPAAVQLSEACPSTQISGQFSSHYFDTRAFAGRTIKIQFKQALTDVNGPSFTLIDQLVLFRDGEQALFFSRPYAQAGFGVTANGTPYLDSSGSFDPDRYPSELSYSWWLKAQEYHSARPCLSNTRAGNHQAVLYVNDGQHAISDFLQFYLYAAVGEIDQNDDLQCEPWPSPVSENKQIPIQVETTKEGHSIYTVPGPKKSETPIKGSSPVIKSKPLVESIGKPKKTTAAPLKTPGKPGESLINNPIESVENASTGGTDLGSKSADPAIAKELTPLIESKQTSQPITNIEATSPPTSTQKTEIVENQLPELSKPNQKTYDLAQSGIFWEPYSQLDGNLLITTPAFFPRQVIRLIDSSGKVIETADYVGRSEKGARYTFSQDGAAYPLNCILRVGNTDYLVINPVSASPAN